MLVAVNYKIGCFEEQSSFQHVSNSGNAKGNPAHANPEPSLSNQEGVEARRDAPLVGDGMVQLSLKDESKLLDRHHDLNRGRCFTDPNDFDNH